MNIDCAEEKQKILRAKKDISEKEAFLEEQKAAHFEIDSTHNSYASVYGR